MYGEIARILDVWAAMHARAPFGVIEAPFWWQRFLEITAVVVWPVVVIVVVVLFRRPVKALLERAVQAKLPGGTELRFGNASVDKEKDAALSAPIGAPLSSQIQWTKHANVFWLGHDLMWTMDVVLRGAPRSSILHGFRQCLHHLRQIGLTGEVEHTLEKVGERAASLKETDWTQAVRDQCASQLRDFIRKVGDIANASQKGFRSDPDS